MRKVIVLALLVLGLTIFAAEASATRPQTPDPNGCFPSETYFMGTCHPNGEPLTFCHVAGLASDPANYITLTTAIAGAVGQAGHFGENGTANAGHENDYLGACVPPVDPPVTCEEDPQQPGCDIPGDPNCQTDPELCPVFPPVDPPDKPAKPPASVCTAAGCNTLTSPERGCDVDNHETGDQNAACASLPHTGMNALVWAVGIALLLAGLTFLALDRWRVPKP